MIPIQMEYELYVSDAKAAGEPIKTFEEWVKSC